MIFVVLCFLFGVSGAVNVSRSSLSGIDSSVLEDVAKKGLFFAFGLSSTLRRRRRLTAQPAGRQNVNKKDKFFLKASRIFFNEL